MCGEAGVRTEPILVQNVDDRPFGAFSVECCALVVPNNLVDRVHVGLVRIPIDSAGHSD